MCIWYVLGSRLGAILGAHGKTLGRDPVLCDLRPGILAMTPWAKNPPGSKQP